MKGSMKNLSDSKPKRRGSPDLEENRHKLIHHTEAESPDECSMLCLEYHYQLVDCDFGWNGTER